MISLFFVSRTPVQQLPERNQQLQELNDNGNKTRAQSGVSGVRASVAHKKNALTSF